MDKKILIVGNWKMNGTIEETIKRITTIQRKVTDAQHVEVVIAPPFTALYSASVIIQDTPIRLAAQNLHWETEGAYTGEISGSFLKDVGCNFVIIGHSERRIYFNEDDSVINKKIRTALSSELVPIFCVGESEKERDAKETFLRLETQLKKGLNELYMHDFEGFCVAYEPVWAIGTGKAATTAQISEVHSWIRNYIAKAFDAPTSNQMRILYGGSVAPDNARDFLKIENVDGLLVGGASLEPERFLEIVEAAKNM